MSGISQSQGDHEAFDQLCHAHPLAQDPAFDGFTHFLRLDSDAIFKKPVVYDLFAELVGGGFLTAYSMLGMPEIWPGQSYKQMLGMLLDPVIGDLLQRGVIPPSDLTGTGNHGLADTLWSGPLQLSSLSLYRGAEFLRFMELIDVWKITALGVREQATHTVWLKQVVPRAKLAFSGCATWTCTTRSPLALGARASGVDTATCQNTEARGWHFGWPRLGRRCPLVSISRPATNPLVPLSAAACLPANK